MHVAKSMAEQSRLNPNNTYRLWLVSGAACVLVWYASAQAYTPPQSRPVTPQAIKEQLQGLEPKAFLGQQLALEYPLVGDTGQVHKLSDFWHGSRPLLLAMVYYRCPNLCNFQLSALFKSLAQTGLKVGEDYHFLAVSIDPKEGPDLAQQKKTNYLKEFFPQETSSEGVSFLTGSPPAIKSLADSLGFEFRWSDNLQQYVHGAVTYVLTPSGKVARQIYGINFDPQLLRLSLVEASHGRIARLVDRLRLFCFQFDPGSNRYSLYAYNIMRAGSVLVLFMLALFLVPQWYRDFKRRR